MPNHISDQNFSQHWRAVSPWVIHAFTLLINDDRYILECPEQTNIFICFLSSASAIPIWALNSTHFVLCSLCVQYGRNLKKRTLSSLGITIYGWNWKGRSSCSIIYCNTSTIWWNIQHLQIFHWLQYKMEFIICQVMSLFISLLGKMAKLIGFFFSRKIS